MKTNNIQRQRFSFLAYTIIMICSACQFSKKASARLYKEASAKHFDMLVVPGIQFENKAWGSIMRARVYWAKHLYDKGIAKNIMFSGSAVYTPYYEAEIMKLYAQELGIPKEHLFTETMAEHSTENIYYSYKKARKLGFTTVALASDPFQTKLLRRFTRRKVSPDVQLIPFVTDTMKVIEPEMKDPMIECAKAFKENFKSIVKRESKWRRFRGTMGSHIDKKAYDSLGIWK